MKAQPCSRPWKLLLAKPKVTYKEKCMNSPNAFGLKYMDIIYK
jgi:hypothetical protein